MGILPQSQTPQEMLSDMEVCNDKNRKYQYQYNQQSLEEEERYHRQQSLSLNTGIIEFAPLGWY
ncbi:MAG: hypothetical protein WAM42_20105 [Candidatus Nitrosopolaris sp.]